MKRLLIPVAILAMFVSACKAEVRLVLEVAENGTGTLAAEVGIDDQLRNLIDTFAGDGEAIISELDLGLDGESSTRVEGELTVYTTEVTFDDVASIPEAAGGDFTSFNLELTDDGASLEATLDLAGGLDLSQFPVDASSLDEQSLEARVVVTLPGDVSEHNADEVAADGAFVWNIPLDGELYMFANTLYPKAGFPWWLAGLLAFSAALAVGVWLAAVRREKISGKQLPPAPTPPPVDNPDRRESAATPEAATPESPFFDIDSDQ